MIPDIPFEPFRKIPRLMREICITEKIDGTNASVLIVDPSDVIYEGDGVTPSVYAASRKRWITPEKDNFGFAAWVAANADTLAADLGPGHHFGEWWGGKIQRGYGIQEKRFSLFNTHRWGKHAAKVDERCERTGSHPTKDGKPLCACCEAREELSVPEIGLGVVPVLYEGPFDMMLINTVKMELKAGGSKAAPGFMNPEGIVVFFKAANQAFKITLEGDGPKGA